MDIFNPEKRSEIMRKIGPKNSKAEVLFRKKLFALGLRYRLHAKELPGKPDIVFRPFKSIVFIDGDWWHGRNYKKEYSKYPEFWQKKIKGNIERDKKVTKELKSLGWKVFRFWQKDIEKEPDKYVNEVYVYIRQRM